MRQRAAETGRRDHSAAPEAEEVDLGRGLVTAANHEGQVGIAHAVVAAGVHDELCEVPGQGRGGGEEVEEGVGGA